jgi:histidine ammonia-lyase
MVNRRQLPRARSAIITLDGSPLTPRQVEAVAHGARVRLAPVARARLAASRRALERAAAAGTPLYGVNTGFGSFSRERISSADLRTLQHNLVRSHASGVGPPLPDPIVRATMLLLAASLCRGLSGVRPALVERLVGMLNASGGGVVPVVPEVGSVGASGDLAPLAHIALVVIGEGTARINGRPMPGARALRAAGIAPLPLEAKEGLALINGTHLMAARGAMLLRRVDRLLDAALVAAAMSIDACRATDAFLDPRVHAARGQPGQAEVARRLRTMLRGSQVIRSHRKGDPRVQDPYSFRCAPQVLGAVRDAMGYVKHALATELGAVTDNPLVLGGRVVSAGNFHGMPIALPLDVLTLALAHVAGVSERRVYHMLSGSDQESGLPPFLSPRPGLCSGLMIAQYAAAACCNEIVGLATPASVANLPTSAGMEDYNSFGPRAAAKAERAAALARSVIAIELLCAAEGLEYQRPLRSGTAVERAHRAIRRRVRRLTTDRPPAPDIAAIEALIEDGGLTAGE